MVKCCHFHLTFRSHVQDNMTFAELYRQNIPDGWIFLGNVEDPSIPITKLGPTLRVKSGLHHLIDSASPIVSCFEVRLIAPGQILFNFDHVSGCW